MQYKHGSASVQSELQLMEHQFRDAEMALTMAEMRSDVESQARVGAARAEQARTDTKREAARGGGAARRRGGRRRATGGNGTLTQGGARGADDARKKMKKQTSLQKVPAGLAKVRRRTCTRR